MFARVPCVLIGCVLLATVGCSSQKALVVVPPPTDPSPPPVAVEEPIPELPRPVDELAVLMASERVQAKGRGKRVGSTLIYEYAMGQTFDVQTAKNRTTSILFPVGEQIIRVSGGEARIVETDAEGSRREVSAWVVERGTSGQGESTREYVTVTPREAGLSTNLVISTSRHMYLVDVTSTAKAFQPMVAFWSELPAPKTPPTSQPMVRTRGRLGVGYEVRTLEGSLPPFVVVRAWDDGQKTYLECAATVMTHEAPAVFVKLGDEQRSLVNYRQHQQTFIIDRLAEAFELRVGHDDTLQLVEVRRGPHYGYRECPGGHGCPFAY